MDIEEHSVLRNFYLRQSWAFLGDVEPKRTSRLIADLADLAANNDELNIAIRSSGGYTEVGFELAQFMEQELKVSITARVWGNCSSAATYPLLCCQKRIAHPQAIFVTHRQSTGIETVYDRGYKKRIELWVEENKQTHQRQVDFYSRKLDMRKKKVKKLLLDEDVNDVPFSAVQALEIGLITEISKL